MSEKYRKPWTVKKNLGEWKDGWVGGWKDGKAGLRIAYSNQKEIKEIKKR